MESLKEGAEAERKFSIDVERLGEPVRSRKVEALIAQVGEVNRVYGGMKVTVPDGALAGQLELGSTGRLQAWQAGDEYVVRVARHNAIQCALTLSDSGRIGSSWGFDFWPLFDGVGHMVENIAMWNSLRGWRFAALFRGEPQRVLGLLDDGSLQLDLVASGSLAQWWVSDDYALSVERFLNPGYGDVPQVSVLARTRLLALDAQSRMEELGFGGSGLHRVVGGQ
ncbi:hypothetical protein [Actinacidiphila guanduensis]|uniref:hypothetical protein n=1 Tax=Actinacidiphila guanduensis TaxID=310781 RepID=UPI0015A0D431|nr:hypothetical protein [Actinacidiphila guanduensis]